MRGVIAAAVVIFVPSSVSPVRAQEVPPLLDRLGGLDVEVLYDVRDVALHPSGAAAVLTSPEPAVHVFSGGEYRTFGREGGGPYEVREPSRIVWSGDSLLVLDTNQKKLVSFAEDGTPTGARSLEGTWARQLFRTDTDTILGTFVPLGEERAAVGLRGSTRDTLLSYSVSMNRIRLEAEGAPSYTTSAPFSSQPVWTVLHDGVLAFWSPENSLLQLVGGAGAEVGQFRSIGERWQVTDADREYWLESEIPQEFMGRRVFEPIRRKARETVRFPERFPPVLALEADPGGGVWIRKTTAGSGEVWLLVSRSGERLGMLRLPAGRELLDVGRERIAVRMVDDLEVEHIELYDRPGWAE